MIHMIPCLIRCQTKSHVNAVLRRFNHWLRVEQDLNVFEEEIYYVVPTSNPLFIYQFSNIFDVIDYIHSVTFYNIEFQ